MKQSCNKTYENRTASIKLDAVFWWNSLLNSVDRLGCLGQMLLQFHSHDQCISVTNTILFQSSSSHAQNDRHAGNARFFSKEIGLLFAPLIEVSYPTVTDAYNIAPGRNPLYSLYSPPY